MICTLSLSLSVSHSLTHPLFVLVSYVYFDFFACPSGASSGLTWTYTYPFTGDPDWLVCWNVAKQLVQSIVVVVHDESSDRQVNFFKLLKYFLLWSKSIRRTLLQQVPSQPMVNTLW